MYICVNSSVCACVCLCVFVYEYSVCACVCLSVYLCMSIGICHETRKETMKEEKEILRKTMEY